MAACPASPTGDDGDATSDASATDTDGTDSGETGTSSDTESESSDSTETGEPDGEEYFRVDDAPPDSGAGGTSIAIDTDGTIYVSWVDSRNGAPDVWLSTSTDMGESWSPSIQIDGDEEPYAAGWSYPRLSLGTSRIAWVGAMVGPRVVARWADKATLDFTASEALLPGDGISEIGYGRLTPDDDLWLMWLAYPQMGAVDVMIGNADLGYFDGAIKVNEGLGTATACACCPMDLIFLDDGTPIGSWRDNNDDIRNMAVVSGGPGYSMLAPPPVYATSTDWNINFCPTQGPRLVQMPDSTIRIVWSDASSGVAETYIASSDDGVTWSAETAVIPGGGEVSVNPVAAVGPSGDLYVAFKATVSATGPYQLTSSADGLSFPAPVPVQPEGGAGQLTFVELDANDQFMGLVGVGSNDNRVYFRRLE